MQHNPDKDFLRYKRSNYKSLGFYAFIIYIALCATDANSFGGQIGLFFLLRFIFILPMLLFSQFSMNFNNNSLDAAVMFSFFWVSLGVSIISYTLGGLTSDYYFGMVIVSFVQYAFTPLSFKKALVLDIFCGGSFFIINTMPDEIPNELIIKQATNYLSFILLKYAVVNKSQRLIKDALKKVSLEEELKNKKNIQSIFGELCHLFNNPLFISLSLLNKIKRGTKDIQMRQNLEKIIESNKRMETVVKRMLELHDSEDVGRVSVESLHSTKE